MQSNITGYGSGIPNYSTLKNIVADASDASDVSSSSQMSTAEASSASSSDSGSVATYSRKSLVNTYHFSDDIINEYFEEDSRGNYRIKPGCKYRSASDIVNDIVQNYRNQQVINNIISGKHRQTDRSADMKKDDSGANITTANYNQYAAQLGLSPDQVQSLKQEALDKFIEDFEAGNLAYGMVRTVLQAIGIKAKYSEQDDMYTISFKFGGISYTINCNKDAAKSGTDEITAESLENEAGVKRQLEADLKEVFNDQDLEGLSDFQKREVVDMAKKLQAGEVKVGVVINFMEIMGLKFVSREKGKLVFELNGRQLELSYNPKIELQKIFNPENLYDDEENKYESGNAKFDKNDENFKFMFRNNIYMDINPTTWEEFIGATDEESEVAHMKLNLIFENVWNEVLKTVQPNDTVQSVVDKVLKGMEEIINDDSKRENYSVMHYKKDELIKLGYSDEQIEQFLDYDGEGQFYTVNPEKLTKVMEWQLKTQSIITEADQKTMYHPSSLKGAEFVLSMIKGVAQAAYMALDPPTTLKVQTANPEISKAEYLDMLFTCGQKGRFPEGNIKIEQAEDGSYTISFKYTNARMENTIEVTGLKESQVNDLQQKAKGIGLSVNVEVQGTQEEPPEEPVTPPTPEESVTPPTPEEPVTPPTPEEPVTPTTPEKPKEPVNTDSAAGNVAGEKYNAAVQSLVGQNNLSDIIEALQTTIEETLTEYLKTKLSDKLDGHYVNGFKIDSNELVSGYLINKLLYQNIESKLYSGKEIDLSTEENVKKFLDEYLENIDSSIIFASKIMLFDGLLYHKGDGMYNPWEIKKEVLLDVLSNIDFFSSIPQEDSDAICKFMLCQSEKYIKNLVENKGYELKANYTDDYSEIEWTLTSPSGKSISGYFENTEAISGLPHVYTPLSENADNLGLCSITAYSSIFYHKKSLVALLVKNGCPEELANRIINTIENKNEAMLSAIKKAEPSGNGTRNIECVYYDDVHEEYVRLQTSYVIKSAFRHQNVDELSEIMDEGTSESGFYVGYNKQFPNWVDDSSGYYYLVDPKYVLNEINEMVVNNINYSNEVKYSTIDSIFEDNEIKSLCDDILGIGKVDDVKFILQQYVQSTYQDENYPKFIDFLKSLLLVSLQDMKKQNQSDMNTLFRIITNYLNNQIGTNFNFHEYNRKTLLEVYLLTEINNNLKQISGETDTEYMQQIIELIKGTDKDKIEKYENYLAIINDAKEKIAKAQLLTEAQKSHNMLLYISGHIKQANGKDSEITSEESEIMQMFK